jgi:hypothetical protein
MRRTLLLTTATAALAAGLCLTAAQAAPVSGITLSPLSTQSLIEKAGWRRHCWRWRHICANRWGWGGWRFHRCMVIHGC